MSRLIVGKQKWIPSRRFMREAAACLKYVFPRIIEASKTQQIPAGHNRGGIMP